eukprot:jgi/Ulvmu1/6645/UM003_0283.1
MTGLPAACWAVAVPHATRTDDNAAPHRSQRETRAPIACKPRACMHAQLSVYRSSALLAAAAAQGHHMSEIEEGVAMGMPAGAPKKTVVLGPRPTLPMRGLDVPGGLSCDRSMELVPGFTPAPLLRLAICGPTQLPKGLHL